MRRWGLAAASVAAVVIGVIPAVTTSTTDRADALSHCYGNTYGPHYTTSGTCVRDIQQILNIWSMGPYHLSIDGQYGNQTINDVSQFQDGIYEGLTPDGIVGPKTWKWLCTVDSGTDGPEVDAGCPIS